MKNIFVFVLLAVVFAGGAWFGSRYAGDSGTYSSQPGSAEKEILYWVAPMDPNFRRDKPGKSPMGMDLVPVYAGSEPAGEGVQINPDVVQNLGVRTAMAESGKLWRKIRATGSVGYDESRISHIHVRVSGWISDLSVSSKGEKVSKGQLLFRIYSPELVNAQKELLLVRSSNRELTGAASEKLYAMGMTRGEVEQVIKTGKVLENIEIYSPQDGVVAELNVRDGMHINPSTVVTSIADLSSVWVHAQVYEQQLNWVREGQYADASLKALPGELFEGKVDYVYPELDPHTRTLNVRLVFENPDARLKPNMYGAVVIYGGPSDNVVSIPREALIRSGDTDRVILALGEGRFTAQEVLAGMESGNWVEIREGLQAGDEVVTSGQFMIDSEASMSGSIRRLSEAGVDEPVFGAGVIQAVRMEDGVINMTHDPIEALGWPEMTMDFMVSENVDLSQAKAGQTVHFSLLKKGDMYVIDMLHIMEEAP